MGPTDAAIFQVCLFSVSLLLPVSFHGFRNSFCRDSVREGYSVVLFTACLASFTSFSTLDNTMKNVALPPPSPLTDDATRTHNNTLSTSPQLSNSCIPFASLPNCIVQR